MGFLNMELSKTLGTSRTARVLKEIHDHIRWEALKRILLEDYPVGKSPVDNASYPPLMLLKVLLFQKWFGIRCDPELENQINDRTSFKVFMGLPLGDASSDHSLISRFRDRVGSKVMERVHAGLLGQLQKKGFSIDAGLAVDARLVRSVLTPVSKDKTDEKKQEREQRKQDTTKKLPPKVYKVYGDKGYHGHANREFLHINDMADGIVWKDERNAVLTEMETTRNKMISKVRYKIEQYFGVTRATRWRDRPGSTLVKEGWDRLCHAIAFNIKRSYLAGGQEDGSCSCYLRTGMSGGCELPQGRGDMGKIKRQIRCLFMVFE